MKDENKKLSVAEELEELNKLFAKRYTDEDEEYIQMVKTPSTNPPIVDDWDQNKNNSRNQRRDYTNNQYRSHSYDNRYRQNYSRSPPRSYDKRQ